MRIFVLTLILAVLAAAAIRVWFVDLDEEAQRAEVGVAALEDEESIDPAPVGPLVASISNEISNSDNDDKEKQEEDIPVYYAGGYPDLRELLEFLGLDPECFIADATAWYRERGISMGFDAIPASAYPDQPYDQYDEQTLMGFSESGDMWAQIRLGERWLMTRPADSIAMLRQAAEQGSATAMHYIGLIYRGNFSLLRKSDRDSPEKTAQAERVIASIPDLELEASRWLGAAQIVSGGMFQGPDNEHFFLDENMARMGIDAERRREFCDAALQTFLDMQDARSASGLLPVDGSASPFSGIKKYTGQCDLPEWPRPDTSHCLKLNFVTPDRDTPTLMSFCPRGSQIESGSCN